MLSERPEPSPISRQRTTIGAVLVFAGILFIGLTFRAGFPHQPGSAGLSPGVVDTAPSGSGPSTTVDLRPAGFLAVTVDEFDRSDGGDGLGMAPTGERWTSVAGAWAIRHGEATGPPAGGTGIVVLDAPASDGLVEVTMAEGAPGVGLVFRFEDEANYWMLVATPPLRAWTVLRVDDGEEVVRGSVGSAPTGNETRISVQLDGDDLRFFVNGIRGLTIIDDTLRAATGIGLVALPESEGRGAWDHFAFSVPRS